jgi:hypothetical protein
MYFQFTHHITQHNTFAYLNVKATLLRHITKTFLYPHTFQHQCTPHRPKYNYTNYKSHTINNRLFFNRKCDPSNVYSRNILHTSTYIHALPDINQSICIINYKSINLNESWLDAWLSTWLGISSNGQSTKRDIDGWLRLDTHNGSTFFYQAHKKWDSSKGSGVSHHGFRRRRGWAAQNSEHTAGVDGVLSTGLHKTASRQRAKTSGLLRKTSNM